MLEEVELGESNSTNCTEHYSKDSPKLCLQDNNTVNHQHSQDKKKSDASQEESVQVHASSNFQIGWFAVLVLISLDSIAIFASDAYLGSLTLVQDYFDVSYGWISVTYQMDWIVGGLGQVVIGDLSDRFGRIPLMIGAFAVFIVGSIGCASSSIFGLFFFFRLLQAIGGGVGVLSIAVLRDVEDNLRVRTQYLAFLFFIRTVLIVIAPTFGGFVGSSWSWRLIFLIVAGWGVLAMIAFLLSIPDTRRISSSRRSPSAEAVIDQNNQELQVDLVQENAYSEMQNSENLQGEEAPFYMALIQLFQDKLFLLATTILTVLGSSILFGISELSLVLVNNYGLNVIQASLCISAIPLVSSVGCFINVILSRRKIAFKYLILGGMIFNLASAIVPLFALISGYYHISIWWIMITMAGTGANTFFNIPSLCSLQVQNMKSSSGLASGIGKMAWMGIAAVVSVILAQFFDGSPFLVFVTIVVGVLLTQIIYWTSKSTLEAQMLNQE